MLIGQTISLRPFERRHLEKTRTWVNDPELARLLNRSRPVTETEHEQWFENLCKQDDRAFFAIETMDGNYIGNVWLWNIEWRHRKAELRIVIGERAHIGRGVGTVAISLLCDYAFANMNLHKVYAFVLAINPRARRAFEKAGFALEGTLREDRRVDEEYTDVYLLGKLR